MSLLNKRQVKAYTLAQAEQHRAHKFTRVGSTFYVRCDANLRLFIRGYLHRLPSKGKTIV